MDQENPDRLVFVDESGAQTTMSREYGRAPKGERVYDTVPGGRWHTTTLVGSLRRDGSTTCMALEGALDEAAFVAYVQQVLVSTLRAGDIVVWDNLSSHRAAMAKEAIEAVGAQLSPLPSYSSDFNPIEQMWSKIKQFLKGEGARTQKALFGAIKRAFEQVRPSDAIGWFEHCGYG